MEFKFNCIETDIKHRECCHVHLLSGGVREGLSELVVCEQGWEGGEECAPGKSSDRAPGRQGPKCADRSVRGQCGGSPVTVGRRSRQRDQTNKQGLCGLLWSVWSSPREVHAPGGTLLNPLGNNLDAENYRNCPCKYSFQSRVSLALHGMSENHHGNLGSTLHLCSRVSHLRPILFFTAASWDHVHQNLQDRCHKSHPDLLGEGSETTRTL